MFNCSYDAEVKVSSSLELGSVSTQNCLLNYHATSLSVSIERFHLSYITSGVVHLSHSSCSQQIRISFHVCNARTLACFSGEILGLLDGINGMNEKLFRSTHISLCLNCPAHVCFVLFSNTTQLIKTRRCGKDQWCFFAWIERSTASNTRT